MVYGGAGLNIMNTDTLQSFGDLGIAAATVSYELAMNKISKLGSDVKRGYIAYGRLPVMRVRNCPNRAAGNCGSCSGISSLTDRTNARFPMVCDKKRYTTILNCVPLHIGGKNQAPSDFRLLYFTLETAAECKEAAFEISSDRDADYPRTGGLYYRAVK